MSEKRQRCEENLVISFVNIVKNMQHRVDVPLTLRVNHNKPKSARVFVRFSFHSLLLSRLGLSLTPNDLHKFLIYLTNTPFGPHYLDLQWGE